MGRGHINIWTDAYIDKRTLRLLERIGLGADSLKIHLLNYLCGIWEHLPTFCSSILHYIYWHLNIFLDNLFLDWKRSRKQSGWHKIFGIKMLLFANICNVSKRKYFVLKLVCWCQESSLVQKIHNKTYDLSGAADNIWQQLVLLCLSQKLEIIYNVLRIKNLSKNNFLKKWKFLKTVLKPRLLPGIV